ncbi:MAG: recombinase family protein, partial [Bacteroidota bacterium]|nr:recombinase family protein [Bacteroidota bacterium]
TARAKEGRYIATKPPFGYIKQGEKKERKLHIEEEEAKVVKFIYDAFLQGMPLYKIKEKAYELGFKTKGNTAIEKVLANPVYAGMLKVQGFKEYPGGIFPAIHEPIIDITTWQMVQNKMKMPIKTRTVIDEEIPLRGVLKCHCGNYLTGAPSRGKSGKYFYYYKCKASKHNNISAIKAHNQFLGTCELMSLPEQRIVEIKNGCNLALETDLKSNKKKILEKKQLLEETQEKMYAVEEKWIKNEIARDTYERWYLTYNSTILNLKGAIERLGQNQGRAFTILQKNLEMLTNIKYVYSKADIMQKREFVNLVFDNNLYYQEGIYRTPTMLNIFSHNSLKMKEKGYLIYERKRDDFSIIPFSGAAGSRTLVQTYPP